MERLDVLKVYADLHQIPEIAFDEHKTSAYIADALEALGYEVTRNIGGKTSVMGILRGEEPGPVLMMRADMDALPFKNEDGTVEAVHACGHDSHSSMLLAAASELVGKIKKGTLKLIFQAAEENLEGALSVCNAGVVQDVDYCLGVHIRPIQEIPPGTMSGSINHVSSTFMGVRLEGVAAHASRPHLGVNCCEAAAMVVNAITAIKLNPNFTWSAKVTAIRSESAAVNIIPDKGELWLDVRAQNNELMDELIEKIKTAVQCAAAANGAKSEVFFPGAILPASDYDDDLKAELAEEIKKVVGEDKFVPECSAGGEDFHFYKKFNPSMKTAYFGVGVGAAPGLHHRAMSFDPCYLPNGVKVLVAMALRKLG